RFHLTVVHHWVNRQLVKSYGVTSVTVRHQVTTCRPPRRRCRAARTGTGASRSPSLPPTLPRPPTLRTSPAAPGTAPTATRAAGRTPRAPPLPRVADTRPPASARQPVQRLPRSAASWP